MYFSLKNLGISFNEKELFLNIDGKSADTSHQVALDLAKEILLTKGRVPEELLTKAKDLFSEQEIIEIFFTTMNTTFTNLFSKFVGAEIDFPEIPVRTS